MTQSPSRLVLENALFACLSIALAGVVWRGTSDEMSRPFSPGHLHLETTIEAVRNALLRMLTLVGHAAQTIVQGIEATEIVPGRCEVIDEDQPFGCVVDAADTPAALSRLMDGLRECHPKRLILVLGCPGEQDQGKRPFMGEIAHYKVRASIVSTHR